MASSIIIGLSLLIMFYGRIAAGGNGEASSLSSISRYGCGSCCSRIANQTTILKSISYANEKLTDDIGQIKEEVPSELKRLAVNLEKQSSELTGVKASVDDVSISLNKHSEELLVHDSRLKEQGLLLAELNSLVKSKLERQSVDLDALKTSVGTDIPSKLETQSSELKGMKASVSEVAISLNKHSADLLVHDSRLKEQGLLLAELNTLVKSKLERQAVDLEAVKTSVGADISSKLETQSSELKASVAISLKKHSEDLLVHDARLKEQGLLLAKLNSLVNEMHDSLVPKDCSDIRARGRSASGVYRVYPGSLAKRIEADVYCDMTTPGGNWLVFQRRKDGSVNFERTWIEYQNGFGNPSGEFWLGNELLYLLTSNRKYKLRIDMEDFDRQKRYAEYATFSIGSSADRYRLTVSGYTGNAGDSISNVHNGMQFSTKDADNDKYGGSCAQTYRGAWWYNICHQSNLNGLYLRGPHKSHADGIGWNAWRGHYYSLKITEMKIAAVN